MYVTQVEHQLIGAEGLEIRVQVDGAYDRIVQAMFDSLMHMAKMEQEGEDKGQLNYHVILIGEKSRGFTRNTCSPCFREHALLRRRGSANGIWHRRRLSTKSRGYLRGKLARIRETRDEKTLCQDYCESRFLRCNVR